MDADGYRRRWISTPRPNRSASPNTASRWPFGSRSIAHGSSPPTVSAPRRSASSNKPSVPGRTSSPLCGNATRSMPTYAASASRMAITPSMPEIPTSVSTSTCVRICVVPCDTDSAICRPDCRRASIGSARRCARSLSILSISRGPTALRYHAMPRRFLSRCVCASTNPGSARRPPPSSTRNAPTGRVGPMATMRPSRISMSAVSPPFGRTFTSNMSWVISVSSTMKDARDGGRVKFPLTFGHI